MPRDRGTEGGRDGSVMSRTTAFRRFATFVGSTQSHSTSNHCTNM